MTKEEQKSSDPSKLGGKVTGHYELEAVSALAQLATCKNLLEILFDI